MICYAQSLPLRGGGLQMAPISEGWFSRGSWKWVAGGLPGTWLPNRPLQLCLLCLIVFSLLIYLSKVFLPHFVRGLHGASGTHLAGEGAEAGSLIEGLAQDCEKQTEKRSKSWESLGNVVGPSLCMGHKLHNVHPSTWFPSRSRAAGSLRKGLWGDSGRDCNPCFSVRLRGAHLSCGGRPWLLSRWPGCQEALPASSGRQQGLGKKPGLHSCLHL